MVTPSPMKVSILEPRSVLGGIPGDLLTMARNRRKKYQDTGHLVQLPYRGLEWCDECGAHLDPGDRISGLCPECQDLQPTPHRSKLRLNQDH